MGHGFSRQITEKYEIKYENENYILEHSKKKWKLYFRTLKKEMETIFCDGGSNKYLPFHFHVSRALGLWPTVSYSATMIYIYEHLLLFKIKAHNTN